MFSFHPRLMHTAECEPLGLVRRRRRRRRGTQESFKRSKHLLFYIQWNPALRTPGYCGQFRLSRCGKAHTFLLKISRLIRTPVNIIRTLWRVPLVSVLTGFHCTVFDRKGNSFIYSRTSLTGQGDGNKCTYYRGVRFREIGLIWVSVS